MFGGFNATKLKAELKMAVSRIQIASNKKAALLKQNMRQVAVLLAEDPPKEEMACIKAEALIRDDNLLEALEILQLECEMLHERIKLIDYSKNCPEDLVSVVSTIMWASHRVDIPELLMVRKQFRAKYGKKFEDNALANTNHVLNERVVAKLSVQPPAAFLVQCYLQRICEQFEVDWQPRVRLTASEMVEPMRAPQGYSVGAGKGTGLGAPPTAPPQENASVPDIPPVAPMAPPRPPPVFQAHPYVAPSASSTVTGSFIDDDFGEADIFVPPTAPRNGLNHVHRHNNDDDDESGGGKGNNPVASGKGDGQCASTSYEDLAARFNNLKNI